MDFSASESIHLNQPAVSIRIRELVKYLEIELLRRSGCQVRLTEAGKVVADYTARVITIMSDMNRAIDEIKGRLTTENGYANTQQPWGSKRNTLLRRCGQPC